MSIEKGKAYFASVGMLDRVKEFTVSSATVALAAQALGCEECRIAKTLSFHVGERVVLIVCAGDVKIDNAKYKAFFGAKAKMLAADEVEPLIGHGIGGVCPFGINDGVDVYLDESLKRFEIVYPACGSASSAVELKLDELETHSKSLGWIDVCKPMA
ncbi:MAG: YbaK/EbsC family protein [Clostridia bacterium]|nr:YbaK/EbsC family protein [Clostridia bacterium]